MTSQPYLRIAACSYEGSLFGWDILAKNDNHEEATIGTTMILESNLTFGFNCCTASLKTVAVSKSSGKYLVSGGMDERIKLFNLEENRSIGEITNHSGAITCLEFFCDSYLLSGSEDATICIWRVYDWQCVHILGGHKAGINGFSIHPSGKMALSVSKDNTMKLWNLVQGRCAFTRRLRKPADKVQWNAVGDHYFLIAEKELQLFSAKDNSCIATITHQSRINGATFTFVHKNTHLSDEESPEDRISTNIITSNERIAIICDNKTFSMFDFNGKQ
eukprot:gene16093-21865_t